MHHIENPKPGEQLPTPSGDNPIFCPQCGDPAHFGDCLTEPPSWDELATARPDHTSANQSAAKILSPVHNSAKAVRALSGCELGELASELERQMAEMRSGNMRPAETMLLAHAHTLDAMFCNLVSRAMRCERLDSMERYMRVALKAQAQAARTLEVLTGAKTPRPVVFAKQANLAATQQVNNFQPQERETIIAQNEIS